MKVLALLFTLASTAQALPGWQNLPDAPVSRQVKVHVQTTENSMALKPNGSPDITIKDVCEANVNVPLYDTTGDQFKHGYKYQPETTIATCTAIYNKKNVTLKFEGSMHILNLDGVKQKEGVVRLIMSSPGAEDVERTAVVTTKTLTEVSLGANMSDFELIKIEDMPKDELFTTIEFTDAN